MPTRQSFASKLRLRFAGTLMLAVSAVLALSSPSSAATMPSDEAAAVTVRLERLGSVLQAWEAYKQRHIDASGRVVDGANGGISHSEGQGYAMLIATKLADRETFDNLWTWTWQNLGVRADHLFAWQWSPDADPHITDMNNATDGDILIAWALMEAADLWGQPHYRDAARMIARDIAAFTLSDSQLGEVIMPAVAGFGPTDRVDGPVVNLSYWIFPARTALKRAAPDVDWDGVFDSGARILRALHDDGQGDAWPSEWTSLAQTEPAPAEGFDAIFGYNAIRIPLYIAWAEPQSDTAGLLEPFRALRHADGSGPYVVEASTGVAIKPLREAGFAAVATLTECALYEQAINKPMVAAKLDNGSVSDAADATLERPSPIGEPRPELTVSLPTERQNYYPETLNLLAALVQLEAYPACLH